MFKFESRTRFLKRRRREYFDALHDGFVIRGGKKKLPLSDPSGHRNFFKRHRVYKCWGRRRGGGSFSLTFVTFLNIERQHKGSIVLLTTERNRSNERFSVPSNLTEFNAPIDLRETKRKGRMLVSIVCVDRVISYKRIEILCTRTHRNGKVKDKKKETNAIRIEVSI